MTDDTATPKSAPVAPAPAEPVAPATPAVVVQDRPRTSWGRALVIAAVLVGTLLIGGIGGFAVAHAVGGHRPPMGIEHGQFLDRDRDRPMPGQMGPGQMGQGQMVPGQGGPGQGQPNAPQPNQAPPSDGDADNNPAPNAG